MKIYQTVLILMTFLTIQSNDLYKKNSESQKLEIIFFNINPLFQRSLYFKVCSLSKI